MTIRATLVILLGTLLTQAGPSPEVLLKAAMQREQVEGNLSAAMAHYKTIVDQFPEHAVAPQALLQLGGIHEARGERDLAIATYQRIVSVYSRSAKLAAAARERLSVLVGPEGPVDRRIEWPGDPMMAGDLALSPDGHYVSYTDQATGELNVRDLRTGRARQLTNIAKNGGAVEYSAISKDGKFVAFVASDSVKDQAPPGLRVLPLSATGATAARVVVEGAYIVPKAWSADGKRVVVVVKREDRRYDIGLVTMSDGSLRVLKTLEFPGPGDLVALSPDAAFIAYDAAAATATATARQRDVYLLSTGGVSAPVVLEGPSSDSVVGWSPDGRYLVLHSDREGSRGVGLWAVPVANGRAFGDPILLRPDFRGSVVGMAADGTVFYEQRLGTSPATLLVAKVNPTTGALLDAPKFAAHDRQAPSQKPRWSADGKSLMYVTLRPQGPVISIRSVESGLVREVPLGLGYVWTFDWSPDGRSIVFRAGDLQGRQGVFLVNADTGAVRPVVLKDNAVSYLAAQFSRGGEAITYFKGEGDFSPKGTVPGRGSYVEWDIATERERTVHDLRAFWLNGRYPMGRSPDGRYLLAMTDGQPTTTLLAHDTTNGQTREVFRVDRPQGFNHEGGLQWMPDSRAFVVNARGVAPNQRELWRIPLDGGQPHKLDIGVSNLINSAIAIHPDGSQIAFVAGDPIPSKATAPTIEFRVIERLLPPGAKAGRVH